MCARVRACVCVYACACARSCLYHGLWATIVYGIINSHWIVFLTAQMLVQYCTYPLIKYIEQIIGVTKNISSAMYPC